MAAATGLERELGTLTVAQPSAGDVYPTRLPIHIRPIDGNWRARGTPDPAPIAPTFTGHKVLGGFRITEDKSYQADDGMTHHPKLVSSSDFARFVGADLSLGFEAATFLANHYDYQELKQKYFMKWLIENDYFKKVEKKEYAKPDFICFDGRIADTMITPKVEEYCDWEICATKFRDVIYLWTENTGRQARTLKRNKGTYYELRLIHMLKNMDSSAPTLNEWTKDFAITEAKFGTHQLLVMNKVEIQDEGGALVRTCPSTGNEKKRKYLKYWALCVVPGIAKLVIGERNYYARLLSLDSYSTNQWAQEQEIDTQSCLDFEDRFLKWIKECFKNAEDGNVKEFSWKLGYQEATVTNMGRQGAPKLLPEWFAGKVREMMDKKEAETAAGSSPNPDADNKETHDGKPKIEH